MAKLDSGLLKKTKLNENLVRRDISEKLASGRNISFFPRYLFLIFIPSFSIFNWRNCICLIEKYGEYNKRWKNSIVYNFSISSMWWTLKKKKIADDQKVNYSSRNRVIYRWTNFQESFHSKQSIIPPRSSIHLHPVIFILLQKYYKNCFPILKEGIAL